MFARRNVSSEQIFQRTAVVYCSCIYNRPLSDVMSKPLNWRTGQKKIATLQWSLLSCKEQPIVLSSSSTAFPPTERGLYTYVSCPKWMQAKWLSRYVDAAIWLVIFFLWAWGPRFVAGRGVRALCKFSSCVGCGSSSQDWRQPGFDVGRWWVW